MSDILLKGGYVTTDPRLDRIIQLDVRNALYPAIRGLAGMPIKRNNWEVIKSLDQGQEGACVGFGVTHDLIASPVSLRWPDDETARYIYHEAQKADDWEGGSYEGADPFYEGTSVLAGIQVAQSLGFFDRYEWTFSVEELRLAIPYKGPAVIGVDWFEGMFEPDRNHFIHADGLYAGGHCLLITGVNPVKEYFVLHNSWGTTWGFNGNARISFSDVDTLFNVGNMEACIPVDRKKLNGLIV